jgi:MFS family permease
VQWASLFAFIAAQIAGVLSGTPIVKPALPPGRRTLRLMSMKLAGRPLVVAMCLGQLGNLLPHVAVPAVMPRHLMPAWELGGAEAGMMASALALGYMFAVPLLTTLTDRIDARNVLLVGSIGSALATLAFGLFANGLWSATLIWGLVGVGFAGAYMPGLKALTDRLPPGDVSRALHIHLLGWRRAFVSSQPTRGG